MSGTTSVLGLYSKHDDINRPATLNLHEQRHMKAKININKEAMIPAYI
jgi:hypothetical protein